MKKVASKTVVAACTQRVAAIEKYLSAKDEVFVGGEAMKATDLTQVYQEALVKRAAAITAKGEYKSALAARDAAEAKRLAVDVALQPYVLQRFGANGTEAHDFGYAPKKVGEKSAVKKAKAVLLNKATRDARGTTSRKAKQEIKGALSPEILAALATISGGPTEGAAPPAGQAPAGAPGPTPPAPPAGGSAGGSAQPATGAQAPAQVNGVSNGAAQA
jgi:hypothetical protein